MDLKKRRNLTPVFNETAGCETTSPLVLLGNPQERMSKLVSASCLVVKFCMWGVSFPFTLSAPISNWLTGDRLEGKVRQETRDKSPRQFNGRQINPLSPDCKGMAQLS